MKKIAEGIKVVVSGYFGTQRPFVLDHGKPASTPGYPWPVRSSGGPDYKPLFVENSKNIFMAGLYYGDIYECAEKRYHLFRVVREPSKTIIIDKWDMEGAVASQGMILTLESSGGPSVRIHIPRQGSIENDIMIAKHKIKAICNSLPKCKDLATEDVETYVRWAYLKSKVDAVGGGKHKPHIKISMTPHTNMTVTFGRKQKI